MADESHHRDVNHTFAEMQSDDPNPFLDMHKEDAIRAWRIYDTETKTTSNDSQATPVNKENK